jgi:hypothetical protein
VNRKSIQAYSVQIPRGTGTFIKDAYIPNQTGVMSLGEYVTGAKRREVILTGWYRIPSVQPLSSMRRMGLSSGSGGPFTLGTSSPAFKKHLEGR